MRIIQTIETNKMSHKPIIIGKEGKIVDTFSSITKPSSKKFLKIIEELI